jgi:predicted nucleic acid-binding protein
MHVVDTCGWIEWLTDGTLAENFAPFLSDSANLIVPTLVQFELYKWCLREKDEAAALDVIGLTEVCLVRPLDTRIALSAADISVRKTTHLYINHNNNQNVQVHKHYAY